MSRRIGIGVVALALYAGSASAQERAPYGSTYEASAAPATAIKDATILTGTGEKLEGSTVVLRNGRIEAVGRDVSIPPDATVIDGTGKWVTPGIIDTHSHLGVFPSPSVPSTRDGNEKTGFNTAEVWAEHAVWPQDPGFEAARHGGVTTLHILPGSANLIGGRSVVLKNIPAVAVTDMKFPGAGRGLKMACGENPIAEYGSKGRTPFTRMGNMAALREAWSEARAYGQSGARSKNGDEDSDQNAAIDFRKASLAEVLAGGVPVHVHCYRADEMMQMIELSREMEFEIAAFHHAVEAYKIAPKLAAEGIGVATWANRWGFKLEAYDGIEANAGMLELSGVMTVLHSDSAQLVQRLNIEAALAMASSNRAGILVNRARAITWITANPARLLGIFDQTGSIEEGKMADIVLWSTDPFSIYSKAEMVFVDGTPIYEMGGRNTQPASDLLVGRP